MKAKNKTQRHSSTKAIPYLQIVRVFAFMVDIPFLTLKDQLAAVALYEESILNAGSYAR